MGVTLLCLLALESLAVSGVGPSNSSQQLLQRVQRMSSVRSDLPDGRVRGVRFEMTAPVLVEVPEEVRMWEPAIYTLSFLLPSAYQERPPTPTNDKVRVTEARPLQT
ncbi:hypothetical protein cypCar_00049454 [Cyprinus carpio]|nr:hypothetical protein cypCar_00049454 [Cyprinus carpio]